MPADITFNDRVAATTALSNTLQDSIDYTDAQLAASIPLAPNLANGNRTLTGNRSHAGGGFTFEFLNLPLFRVVGAIRSAQGSTYVELGQKVGTATEGAIYSVDATPSSSNYRHLYTAGSSYMNAGTSVILSTGSADRVTTNNTGTFLRAAHTLSVAKGSLASHTLEVAGSFGAAYIAKSANYTATINDRTIDCTGTITITLPTAVGIAGREYTVFNSGTGTITVNTTSSQTINGASTKTMNVQYSCINLFSDGANWKISATI